MKQVLIQKGQVHVEQVPSPLIEPEQVLVEVAYSLISSGTELASVSSSSKSVVQRVLEKPDRLNKVAEHLRAQGIKKTVAKVRGQIYESVPSGYSCSGVVIQVGDGITDVQPGDRVACAGAGVANHAEIVLVPRNLLAKVPVNCDLRSAASMTLGAIAMQGVRRASVQLGEVVVVIGLGLLGQLTVQLLRLAGCRVIGIDLDTRRTTLATECGAQNVFSSTTDEVVNQVYHITNGYGADATIITAASESSSIVQQAMQMTRKKGRVVVVGAVGLGLQRSPFYEKEIDFLISSSYGPGRYDEKYEQKGVDYPYAYVRWTENRNMQEYLQLVAEGKIQLKSILEHEYDIDEASRAYEELRSSLSKPLGVLLRYPIEESSYISKLNTKIVIKQRNPVRDKVSIAVVGAGSFAKAVHLPNLRQLSSTYRVKAVVSATGSNAKNTATQFDVDYATTDFQDVLDDPDIDAVLICTRHHLHAKQAIQAAKAGKAVLLEKPMALNQDELEEISEALSKHPVPFMVGFNRRFSPAAVRAKEILISRQTPMMISYRMNAGYIPPTHWTQTEQGGGRIVGEACHVFDLFSYLTDSVAVEFSVSSIRPTSEHVLASDNVSVALRYGDGSLAILLYTSLGTADFGKEYMEVFVDGQVLVLDDYRSLRIIGASGKNWTGSKQDKGHLDELRAFAKFIKNPSSPPIPFESLVETSMISIKVQSFQSM